MRPLLTAVATFALVLLLALPAWAGATDLTGTWSIDEAASEPMDEMLLAWGTPGFAVKMMKKLKTSLTIEQPKGQVTIKFKTGVYSYSDTLQPGTEKRTEKRYGSEVEKQERWLDDGTLEASSWFDLKDGTRASTRSHKSLSADGRTLTDHVTFTRADGTEMKARRVYRRTEE
jgi:hypothetical protein